MLTDSSDNDTRKALKHVQGPDAPSVLAIARLKKPVDTLAMAPSEGGRITVVERKLYFTLMWMAQSQGWQDGQDVFKAPLSSVLEKMAYSSKNHGPIREALAAMATTRIDWQSPTAGEGSSWGVSAMIAHAEIIRKKEGSTIEWSYSPKVRTNILDPMPYAKSSLEVQGVLRHYSALALYDICSRYATSATGLTPRKSWLWWRPILSGGADGIDTEPIFKAFNRDVLKKAIFEINKHTMYEVRLITHKVGTRVVDIQFHAKKKMAFSPPLQHIKSENGLKEIGRAIAAGISQQQAELFHDTMGEHSLSQGLDTLAFRQEKTWLRPIDSPADYLGKVLENQTLGNPSITLVDVKNSADVETKQRSKLIESFRVFKLKQAWGLYCESPDHDQADLKSQFEMNFINRSSPSTQKLYKNKGLETNAIRSHFWHFLAKSFFGDTWNAPGDADLLSFSLTHPSA